MSNATVIEGPQTFSRKFAEEFAKGMTPAPAPAPAPTTAPNKEATNVSPKPDAPPAGTNAAGNGGQPAGATPAAAPAPVTPGASTAGPTTQPASGSAPDKGTAAPVPGAAAEPAKAPQPGEERWPRTADEWKKFKTKHADAEAELRREIEKREAKISEYEAKVKELEPLKAQAGEPPAEVKAEIERLRKENEDYSNRLAALEVTQHPKFQAYFKGRTDAQVNLAKAIVGAEKAEQIGKLLALPESDWKSAQIEEFVTDLSPLQQGRIAGVLNALEDIGREKQTEIEKANQSREKLTAEQTAQQAAQFKTYEKLFTDTLTELQDAKSGMPVFQAREGDAEWNQDTAQAIEVAKAMLTGKKANGQPITPQEGIRAALNAAIMPKILKAYAQDITLEQQRTAEALARAERAEAQVKELQTAQPGAGTTTTTASGGEPGEPKLKPGMNPHAAAQWFAERMRQGLTQ